MIPKRRTRPRMMAPKEDAPIVCTGHGKWVRGHECCVAGLITINALGTVIGPHVCKGRIESHHVKTRGAGGGDEQQVPMCSLAHESHHKGHVFRGIDLALLAKRLWQTSPHRVAYERRLSASCQAPPHHTEET